MLLVEKEGGERRREKSPMPLEEVLHPIHATPMRDGEMSLGNKHAKGPPTQMPAGPSRASRSAFLFESTALWVHGR